MQLRHTPRTPSLPHARSRGTGVIANVRGRKSATAPTLDHPRSMHLDAARPLHWVFKIGNRTEIVPFFQDVLGMKPLRHEEFIEGCAAACNGPYDGKWSKTMIGYGPEDKQFVLELTYNYNVKSYQVGNDYRHIVIRNKEAYAKAKEHKGATPFKGPGIKEPAVRVQAPGGYAFVVVEEEVPKDTTVMTELCLAVTDLSRSLAYWRDFLGFNLVAQAPPVVGGKDPAYAVISYGNAEGQAVIRLVELPQGTPLSHGTGYGRLAFATPGHKLQAFEKEVTEAGYTVLTPYVSLPTPGKATVQVIVLADPDGYEICFVGEEGFNELSKVDPTAGILLQQAITLDKSKEWNSIHARNVRQQQMGR